MEPTKCTPKGDRPITRRGEKAGGGIDVLHLPQAKPTDADCAEVAPGFRVYVMFGSIFEPREDVLQEAHGCKKWVPVVPHFADGSVYGQWVRMGGRIIYQPNGVVSSAKFGTVVVVRAREDAKAEEAVSDIPSPPQPPVPAPSPVLKPDDDDDDDKTPLLAGAALPVLTEAAAAARSPPPAAPAVMSAPEAPTAKRSGFDAIDLGVLYKYDRSMHKLDEDFGLMAANLPEGSVLAFPAIGVNNGISYFQSAYRMFYSVVSCLKIEGNPMKRLSGVIFMSPYAEVSYSGCANGAGRRDNSGVRTIQHLLNVLKAHRAAEGEAFCRQCGIMKQDAVLPCGHRICQRCATDIAADADSSACPDCKARFVKFYPCYSAIDCSGLQCCCQAKRAAHSAAPPADKAAEAAAAAVAEAAKAAADPDAQQDSTDCDAKECSGKKSKVKMMFVPCGHHSVHCEDCYASGLGRGKCVVCDEPFYTAVPIPS